MAKRNSKLSLKKVVVTLFSLLAIIGNFYLLHSIYLLTGIENQGRYLVMSLLIAIDLLIITEWRKFVTTKRKNSYYSTFMLLLTLYLLINMFIGFYIKKVYQSIDNVNKDHVTYSTSLIVMNNSKINEIADIKNIKIGILNDKDSIDGYIISQEIINENNLKNNEFVEYSSFPLMLSDLYDGEIDGAFTSTSYAGMFNSIEKFENISEETKIIISKSKKVEKDDSLVSNKKLNEPFSILLMGVDSEKDGLDSSAASNGDSLILVTFNPTTSNITMVSIPRDSYVPISCFAGNIENKITHAAWQGTSCMIKTIENFLDVDIDYYVKINFKGVVGLVNALDGITVDVPQNLCTGNSDREGYICIKPGLQKLNGEQTLVLTRNRHQLAGGDLDREKNQQLVIKAILDKIKTIRNIDQLTNILNSISKNIDTNFTTDQILSFYNIGKEILFTSNEIKINSLLLQGNGQRIYDEGMGLILWNYILNPESVKAVSKEMRYNLNLEKPTLFTSFDYSIDKMYIPQSIGSEYTEYTGYELLPDFTTMTSGQAKNWLNKRGFEVTYKTTNTNSETGTVVGQSIPAFKRLDKITNKNITLYISNKIETPSSNNKENE